MLTAEPLFKIDKPHFHTNGGCLAVGYKLYTYYAGTNNPVAMYSEPSGATIYQNPIVLDSRGEPSGQGIYADVRHKYKVVLKDTTNSVVWSVDDVSPMGIGDITVNGITEIEAGSSNVHVTMSQDGQKATISVDSVRYVTTDNTYSEVLALVNEGILPVLRYEFAEDDVWYLSLRENDADNGYMIFSGPTSKTGVFAYSDLDSSGWTTPRTYGLATLESLQNERQARTAADADLQDQIDNVQIDVDDSLSTDSVNPVENRVVTGAVNSKQDQIPQEQLDEMTDQEIDDLISSLN